MLFKNRAAATGFFETEFINFIFRKCSNISYSIVTVIAQRYPSLISLYKIKDIGQYVLENLVTLPLGRIDIGAAVMTMSRFRVSPRKGHLDRLKLIYSYLHHFKNSSIKFNVEIPDYTHFDNQ